MYWAILLHSTREISAIWPRKYTGITVSLTSKRALKISNISNASYYILDEVKILVEDYKSDISASLLISY